MPWITLLRICFHCDTASASHQGSEWYLILLNAASHFHSPLKRGMRAGTLHSVEADRWEGENWRGEWMGFGCDERIKGRRLRYNFAFSSNLQLLCGPEKLKYIILYWRVPWSIPVDNHWRTCRTDPCLCYRSPIDPLRCSLFHAGCRGLLVLWWDRTKLFWCDRSSTW